MKRQKEIKLNDEEKTATGICWITVYSCDSGNYKTFGFQDFSNSNSLSLELIQAKITENLISIEFFYPEESGIEKFEFH